MFSVYHHRKNFILSMNKDPAKRKPPTEPIKSVQYDLFTSFLTNNGDEVANALELWDAIPKYFLTHKQQEKLRTDKGHADPYQWEYTYRGKPCAVKLQPALIEQDDGSYKAFFPSVTEELVEETLKKFLTDQQYGRHDPDNVESWVRFTLGLIYRELKARGRERNRKQIRHAISIMNRCILSVYEDGIEIYSGPILSDLITVNRGEYLADTDSQHAARLPFFLSLGINRLQYRQFNYGRLMDCNDQLTRWLYKLLIHRYRQASLIDTYHFLYSGVQQGSGLLQQGRDVDNRNKIVRSLKELQKKGVLLSYTAENEKSGRKIADVKYTVTGATEFIKEQKAANKRARQNLNKAHSFRLVDKAD